MFTQILQKDVEFYDSRKTGDLISRLEADTTVVEGGLSNHFSSLVYNSVYCLATIIILFAKNWAMALFLIGIMCPFLCTGPVYGRYMKEIYKEVSNTKAKSSDYAEEALSNVRNIKAHATEELETGRLYKALTAVYDAEMLGAKVVGFFGFFILMMIFGTLDGLVFFAAFLES